MTPDTFDRAMRGITEDRQKAILMLLVIMHPKPVTRTQIGESVWHGAPPLSSFANIRQAVIVLNRHLSLFGWRIESEAESATAYSISPTSYRLERIAA